MPLGITSKLFVNAGTFAIPVFVTVDLLSDAALNDKWNQGDSSVRRSRLETAENTNRVLELTGKIRKEVADPAFILLRLAYNTDLIVDVLILDGPATLNGSEGVRFDCKVTNFTEDQGLQVVIFKEFTLKPCISVNLPQQANVAGGITVFTPFPA